MPVARCLSPEHATAELALAFIQTLLSTAPAGSGQATSINLGCLVLAYVHPSTVAVAESGAAQQPGEVLSRRVWQWRGRLSRVRGAARHFKLRLFGVRGEAEGWVAPWRLEVPVGFTAPAGHPWDAYDLCSHE